MATGSVTVFGGTGFIGRHLVPLLVQDGATVRVAVRHPERHVATGPAQTIEMIQADVLDESAIAAATKTTNAIINLVGILTETSTQPYRALHVEGARRVALAAKQQGVTRLPLSKPPT